jgi:putative transposase
MALRKISFSTGEYYHIYNRGNNKQKIFHDNQDKERLVALLYACNQDQAFKIFNLSKGQSLYDISIDNNIIAVGAYCLMSNHFHILVKEIKERGITTFMKKVMTGYVMYYNKKYNKTGGLFEGKFKAEHVASDQYLKYLFAYIHLNPVKVIDPNWKIVGLKNFNKTKNYLINYAHSSLSFYLRVERVENKVINETYFPDYFPTTKSVWKDLNIWLHFS